MPDSAAVEGLLCVLGIALAIELVLSALFLLAAIALFNKMAGGARSPRSVPPVKFGKALMITFIIRVFDVVALLFLVFGLGVAGAAASTDTATSSVVQFLIPFAVNLLVMSMILSEMLPTTPRRALLVTLCYLLLVVIIGLVGGVIAVAILTVSESSSGHKGF
jgi:hypothetical protein